MADRKWSELGAPVTPTDTDTVAMQRGNTNPRWSFATLRTYLGVIYDALYVPLTRLISTGDGLQGGGNLTQDRTLSVDSTVARTDVAETFSSTVTAETFIDDSGQVYSPKNPQPTTTGTYKEAQNNGAGISVDRSVMNFIPGAGITVLMTDRAGTDATDVQIDATAGSGGIGRGTPFALNYLGIITDAGVGTEEISSRRGLTPDLGAAVYFDNTLTTPYVIDFTDADGAPGTTEGLVGPISDLLTSRRGVGLQYWGGEQNLFGNGGIYAYAGHTQITGLASADDLPLRPDALGAQLLIDDTGFITVGPAVKATFEVPVSSGTDLTPFITEPITPTFGAWRELTALTTGSIGVVGATDAFGTVSGQIVQSLSSRNQVDIEVQVAPSGGADTPPPGGNSVVVGVNYDYENHISVVVPLGAIADGTSWSVYLRARSTSVSTNLTQTWEGTVKPSRLTIWEPASGGGSGQTNDGANVGLGDGEIYRDKTGVNINFRRLKSTDSAVGIATDTDEVDLTLGAAVAGTGLTQTAGVINAIGGEGITANANDIAASWGGTGGDFGTTPGVARSDHTHSTLYAPITLTGDGELLSHDGTQEIKIGVGTNGQQLVARPGALPGSKVAWETISGGGGGDMLSPVAAVTVGELYAAGDTAGVQTTGTGILGSAVSGHLADGDIHVDHTAVSVVGGTSLTGGGTISASPAAITLLNDADTPGNNFVYGTDGVGTKGWKADPAGGSGDVIQGGDAGGAGGTGYLGTWDNFGTKTLGATQLTDLTFVNTPSGPTSSYLFQDGIDGPLQRTWAFGIVLSGSGVQTSVSSQVDPEVGYTGTSRVLAPADVATQTPTPSEGQFRELSGGSASFTIPAMTEIGFVSWTFGTGVYTLDLSNYQVIGSPPAAATVSLVLANFGAGGAPQTATWQYQA